MKTRLYAIYDGEKLIDTLNVDETAALIGSSEKSVYAAASGGYKLKRRYSIIPVEDECITRIVTDKFCEEWDKTRLEILHKGRATI